MTKPKPFDLEQHMQKRERQLKNAPTRHELLMINLLRQCSIAFAFQKGFMNRDRSYHHGTIYIADFYLPDPWNAIIEIDGTSHTKIAQQTSDALRDSYFTELGLRVIRIANTEVKRMTAHDLRSILSDETEVNENDPAEQFKRFA
jgi:very-short-patch-repair endonuclease